MEPESNFQAINNIDPFIISVNIMALFLKLTMFIKITSVMVAQVIKDQVSCINGIISGNIGSRP